MRHETQTFGERLRRSGLGTFLCIVLVLAVGVVGWEAHLRGKFHRLTTVEDRSDRVMAEVQPGGHPLVHLTRTTMATSLAPEFTQMTVAPGVGMLVLEALLQSPGRADQSIIQGTPEADIDHAGAHLVGAEIHATAASLEGSHWTAPVELVTNRSATQENTSYQPGGNRCEAVFAGDVNLPSGTVVHTGVETTVSATTTSRGLEMTISARNKSSGQRAVVLDWRPRFLAPEGGLGSFSYVPPKEANGSISPAEQTLGSRAVDTTYASLQHSFLGAGPELLLRNRMEGYVLRMTALTPAMRSVRVQTDKAGQSLLVDFSTAEGSTPAKAPTVLMPGEKLDWRLRIEALPQTSATP